MLPIVMDTRGIGGYRGLPYFVAAAVPAVLLVPFLGKALHLDDPVYVRVAQQIAAHPFDFYGFTMNWYGTDMPVHEFNQNPPGVSYYLAIFGALFGWSERVLHGAIILMAAATGAGIYTLAKHFTRRPLLATLAAVLTPAFIVSATTLMTDIPMLCAYVWAVSLWARGIEKKSTQLLLLASALASLAVLTKYFAISLVPLLTVYTLVHDKSAARKTALLAIPVAVLIAYQLYTARMYGTSLFGAAAGYASTHATDSGQSSMALTFVGLAFMGGCTFSAACLAPLAWSQRAIGWGIALAVACCAIPFLISDFIPPALQQLTRLSPLAIAQSGAFIAAGISLFILAVRDLQKNKDAPALMLALWLIGTFTFSVFINWTINARTLLPLIPPAAILMARAIETRSESPRPWREGAALAIAGAVALWVAAGDYAFAKASREGAREVADAWVGQPATLYFEGHWGFQYYMEEAGFAAVDFVKTELQPGDGLAIPSNNTNIRYLDPAIAPQFHRTEKNNPTAIATINIPLGAGYYSHGYGPLPYVIGHAPPETFTLQKLTAGGRFNP